MSVVEVTGACAGGHPFKQHLGGGSTCSHSSSSTRAEPNILKNSWRLRSDQDGGSGGHLLGQRWMQVREKATGDLLVFIFVKIPLQLSLFFVKVKVFFFTTFTVVLL